MNRRQFVYALAAMTAAVATEGDLDTDRLLWQPGERTWFLPPERVRPTSFGTLEEITREVTRLTELELGTLWRRPSFGPVLRDGAVRDDLSIVGATLLEPLRLAYHPWVSTAYVPTTDDLRPFARDLARYIRSSKIHTFTRPQLNQGLATCVVETPARVVVRGSLQYQLWPDRFILRFDAAGDSGWVGPLS